MRALNKLKLKKTPAREKFYKQVNDEIAANKVEARDMTKEHRKKKSTGKLGVKRSI